MPHRALPSPVTWVARHLRSRIDESVDDGAGLRSRKAVAMGGGQAEQGEAAQLGQVMRYLRGREGRGGALGTCGWCPPHGRRADCSARWRRS
jgi:hypothetical protein